MDDKVCSDAKYQKKISDPSVHLPPGSLQRLGRLMRVDAKHVGEAKNLGGREEKQKRELMMSNSYTT